MEKIFILAHAIMLNVLEKIPPKRYENFLWWVIVMLIVALFLFGVYSCLIR
jgi:hypothetical protein